MAEKIRGKERVGVERIGGLDSNASPCEVKFTPPEVRNAEFGFAETEILVVRPVLAITAAQFSPCR